jgi:transcriptional regulator with XRE-family HTH domain
MPTTDANIRLVGKLTAERLRGRFAYQIAAAAGISAPLLSMIAHGHVRPTDEVALRIAAALDCDPAELGFVVETHVA